MNNFSEFNKSLDDRLVFVTSTKTSRTAFHLAHLIRDYARLTVCVDPAYDIDDFPDSGIRSIEDDRVLLVRGDYRNEKFEVFKRLMEYGVDISNDYLEILVDEVR